MNADRSHTRAKDADRNDTVDLIDAAYSDGQLTAAEREQRTTHALQARTLGALESLTRDLQPVPAVIAPPVRRRRTGLVIAAIVVVAGGIGASFALSGDDEPTPAPTAQTDTEVVEQPEEVEIGDEPVLDAKPLRYSFTPDGVRNYIELYEQEFGTTTALAFGFTTQGKVIAARPDPRGPRKWDFLNQRLVDSGFYLSRDFPPGEVDLRDLDVDAAFRNLEAVKKATGRSSFPTLGMSVVISDGTAGVSVAAGDSRTQDCLMQWTSMDGEVLGDPVQCE